MYCPKCKHTSFDHLSTCPKCGYDWQTMRTALNLGWLQSKGHDWLPESPSGYEKPSPPLAAEGARVDNVTKPAERSAFEAQEPDTRFSPEKMMMETEPPPLVDLEDSFTFPEATASAGDPDRNVGAGLVQPEMPRTTPPPLQTHDSGMSPEPTIQADEIETVAEPESGQPAAGDPSGDSGEELPVWEIELPQDILPSDYFPDPGEKPVEARKDQTQPGAGSTEIIGDIEYDFDDVEVIFPDVVENNREGTQTNALDSTPKHTRPDDTEQLDEFLDNLATNPPGENR